MFSTKYFLLVLLSLSLLRVINSENGYLGKGKFGLQGRLHFYGHILSNIFLSRFKPLWDQGMCQNEYSEFRMSRSNFEKSHKKPKEGVKGPKSLCPNFHCGQNSVMSRNAYRKLINSHFCLNNMNDEGYDTHFPLEDVNKKLTEYKGKQIYRQKKYHPLKNAYRNKSKYKYLRSHKRNQSGVIWKGIQRFGKQNETSDAQFQSGNSSDKGIKFLFDSNDNKHKFSMTITNNKLSLTEVLENDNNAQLNPNNGIKNISEKSFPLSDFVKFNLANNLKPHFTIQNISTYDTGGFNLKPTTKDVVHIQKSPFHKIYNFFLVAKDKQWGKMRNNQAS